VRTTTLAVTGTVGPVKTSFIISHIKGINDRITNQMNH
jgi:hypothetical protein